MVASKSNLFDEELQKRANLFRVLAHPARLQILQHLVPTRACLSGDISDLFPLKRTTINQHMKELKDAGLIVGQERGTKIVYCLNSFRIKEVENIVEDFVNEIRLTTNFCCEYNPK